MSIKLNTTILQHITKQISAGKVIWALLTLNEYNLAAGDPLLKCLRFKARLILNTEQKYKNFQSLCSIILDGKKYNELDSTEQNTIQLINETAPAKNINKKQIVLIDYSKRKMLRQEYSNVYFSSKPSNLWSSRRRSYAFVNSTKREASSRD